MSVLPVTDPLNVAFPPAVMTKLICPFAIAHVPPLVLPASYDLARVVSPQLEQWLQPTLLSDRLGTWPSGAGTFAVGPDHVQHDRQQTGARALGR